MGIWGKLQSATGLVQTLIHDESEDKLVVKTESPQLESLLNRNRSLYNLDDRGYGKTGEWRRAASLDNLIVHEWLMKGINIFDEGDWPKVAAMLDHPNYSRFRTAPGRISKRPPRDHYLLRGGHLTGRVE